MCGKRVFWHSWSKKATTFSLKFPFIYISSLLAFGSCRISIKVWLFLVIQSFSSGTLEVREELCVLYRISLPYVLTQDERYLMNQFFFSFFAARSCSDDRNQDWAILRANWENWLTLTIAGMYWLEMKFL